MGRVGKTNELTLVLITLEKYVLIIPIILNPSFFFYFSKYIYQIYFIYERRGRDWFVMCGRALQREQGWQTENNEKIKELQY